MRSVSLQSDLVFGVSKEIASTPLINQSGKYHERWGKNQKICSDVDQWLDASDTTSYFSVICALKCALLEDTKFSAVMSSPVPYLDRWAASLLSCYFIPLKIVHALSSLVCDEVFLPMWATDKVNTMLPAPIFSKDTHYRYAWLVFKHRLD